MAHVRSPFAPVLLLLALLLVNGLGGGPEPARPGSTLIGMGVAEAAKQKALDEYFRGKVIGLEEKVVTLRYDFRDKDQVKDFNDNVPWPIEVRKGQGIKWFDDKMEVIGNSGARHVAEWKGDVHVKVTVTPDNEKDIGGWLSPIGGEKDFATFTLVETFFHKWDNDAGGGNSIIKFGKQWRESGSSKDFIGFRYVVRRNPRDPITPGKPIAMSFGLEKGKFYLATPDFDIKGKDRGKKLKKYFVGFYAIKGRALFDNIEISGELNPDWMKHENIVLRTEQPISAPTEGVDAETQELMDKHVEGEASATRKLVALVSDTVNPAPLRKAVVACLSTGPKQTVRAVLDLLYHADVGVRTDGIAIVKAHLGKDYGYKPKGKESGRSKAIQALNEDLRNNPALLEG